MRIVPTKYVSFGTRQRRTEFLVDRYRGFLKKSILDVGCFEAPLRNMLKGVEYVGIDIVGKPDQIVDLEATERLPFEDNQFQCVICIEVLEHLDALHRVFEELRRVSDRYVIVSLPNCWGCSRQQIQRGRGSISHYGLPAERPVDRHKWFINITQSREFFESKATAELKLLDLCIVEKPRNWLVRAIRKLIYRGDSYANRYAHTLFAVYEKSTGQNE